MLGDYVKAAIELDEDTYSCAAMRVKDKFIKLCAERLGPEVVKKRVRQHHIDGDRTNNTDDYSNFLYLYSESDAHIAAHKYIHAKHLVDTFRCSSDLYILSRDSKTDNILKTPVNISDLDHYASLLRSNAETAIVTEGDKPDIDTSTSN